MGTTPTTSGGKHFLRRSEAADYVGTTMAFHAPDNGSPGRYWRRAGVPKGGPISRLRAA